jgi:predicted MFS family arabinose efflux permease
MLTVMLAAAPSALLLSVPLIVFGYGQGLVMAPLSGAVLATVKPASAGSASGLYGTTTQIGNAAGVAAFGAVYFAAQASHAPLVALGVTLLLIGLSIAASAALLMWMRRAA